MKDHDGAAQEHQLVQHHVSGGDRANSRGFLRGWFDGRGGVFGPERDGDEQQ